MSNDLIDSIWSQSTDLRFIAVKNLRALDRDVAMSPLPPAAALAEAFACHLCGFNPEQALTSEAFGAWSAFQRGILGVEGFNPLEMPEYGVRLAALPLDEVQMALALLRQAADLTEVVADTHRPPPPQALGY